MSSLSDKIKDILKKPHRTQEDEEKLKKMTFKNRKKAK